MEPGECSGAAKPLEELWAKLVSLDSKYSDVEIRSNEMVICSEITCSSLEKHEWCKITRSPDLCSATVQNMSSNITVDGTVLGEEDTAVIKCGTEIISGPDREGYLSYRFKVVPIRKHCKKQLKISLDVEHAKCSICLNTWHDVVTVAPCLHNFCNGCFSEWLTRSQEKHPSVLCPQCRAVVHFVGRNHFLRNIEEVCGTDRKRRVRGLGIGASKTTLLGSTPYIQIENEEKRARKSLEGEIGVVKHQLNQLSNKVMQLEEAFLALREQFSFTQQSHYQGSTDSAVSHARMQSTSSPTLPESPRDPSPRTHHICDLLSLGGRVLATGRVMRDVEGITGDLHHVIVDEIHDRSGEVFGRSDTFGDLDVGDIIQWPKSFISFKS